VSIRGEPVVVPAGKTLMGDVVVVGGTMRLDGTVDGNLVVIAGELHVGPKARVMGDLISVGNEPAKVDGAARVDGARVTVNHTGIRYLLGNILWALDHPGAVATTAALGVVGLMVLVWLLLIRRYESRRFHATVERHPVRSGVAGFFILVGLHVLVVLSFLSRYGIGLAPVFGLAYVLLAVLGWLTVASHVGRMVARKAGWNMGPFLYGLLGVGIGLAVFIVPVAGQVAWALASWIGVGALIAPATLSDVSAGDTAQAPPAEPYAPTARAEPTAQPAPTAQPEPTAQPDTAPSSTDKPSPSTD
jgi:hypothetical protein